MASDATAVKQHPHSSAYYGIASIAISGIFLLMAVPALQLANTLQQSGYRGFDATELRLAAVSGYAGGGLVILLCLIASGMAVAGLRVANRGGEPAVLCLAGFLLSIFATLVWIGCVGAWHSQAWRILWQG
jgi:hypothetical protein